MTNPTVDDRLPVVSYERISSDGERDAHGVGDQHRTNQRTAKRLGWRVVHRYTDNDRSASKANIAREGFEEMIKAVRAGRLPDGQPVRGVVVVADDRLVRRAGDYERFVEALTYDDGRVYADERGPKDLYAEEVEGMGLIGVAFSKIEARKISRRLRAWHRARAEQGRSPGGTRPFGWNDDKITLHPDEAPLLRKAATDFAARRASLNSIVLSWLKVGVKTSLGNDWTTRSLKVTLSNPRLCGWRRMNGEIVKDDNGNPVPGNWEPIIDPDTWLAVDAIMRARKGHRVMPDGSIGNEIVSDNGHQKYLLTGILRCGKVKPDGSVCNCPLRTSFNRATKRHIYHCKVKAQGGCSGVARRADLVDEYVTEAVLAKLEERSAVATTVQPWQREDELRALEKRLSDLGREWRNGGLSNELFFSNARVLESDIVELRREKGRHEVIVQRAALDIGNLRERWLKDELELMQKRAYIRDAVHAIILHPCGGGRRGFDPDLIEILWKD